MVVEKLVAALRKDAGYRVNRVAAPQQSSTQAQTPSKLKALRAKRRMQHGSVMEDQGDEIEMVGITKMVYFGKKEYV